MIPESFTELRRLQAEAVTLCRNAGCPADALFRADCIDDVRREASLALRILNGAVTIAQKAGCMLAVYDLVMPAARAVEALWTETCREMAAQPAAPELGWPL